MQFINLTKKNATKFLQFYGKKDLSVFNTSIILTTDGFHWRMYVVNKLKKYLKLYAPSMANTTKMS